MMKAFVVIALIVVVSCQDCADTGTNQMSGPSDPAQFTSWMNKLQAYRKTAIEQNNLNDSYYDLTGLAWTKTAFIQPQMMVHDRFFYDPDSRQYTVKKYLQDLVTRYGGIDAVLIWQSYTNIGTDDRNQFDLMRSMPLFREGGVKQMIDDFHSMGVSVLFPYNPWDKGTRYEGTTDDITIAQLWKQIGADGFNGDTMSEIGPQFFTSSYRIGHPIALEAENEFPVSQNLDWQVIGWGYWKYPLIPCVSTFKWLIPKHLTNVCNRWAQDHTNDLQFAFFNGVGFESWENVWGIWNQMVPRDAEALRRIATILRFFGDQFLAPDWEPHTPAITQARVYGTKFPGTNGIVWTIVNRSQQNKTGVQMTLPHAAGRRYFDVYHGTELSLQVVNGNDTLSFFIEERGFGAVYATDHNISPAFTQFLQTMKAMTIHPLSYYSSEWTFLTQKMVPIDSTPTVTTQPPGTILIPSANYNFVVNGIEIEGGNTPGVDFQYPWETYPQRSHASVIPINAFYIDKYPVTNAQYKTYLDTTHYQPKDNYNFLRDWTNGTYPKSWDNKPVVWIGLEEARDYCRQRVPTARLPNEWEWQYAAQGTDGRKYPWGNTWDTSRVPVTDKGRSMRGPDNVDAHPSGASPFGVMDMTGNVYQWTNEFVDLHTRAASLRGGNYYQSQGSMWYQPQSYELDKHTKYLLMEPTMDRSGGIGFRCVVDTPNTPLPPCTKPICASAEIPALVVNLTQIGTKDWKHWGLSKSSDVDRKANVENSIGYSIVGGEPLQYSNNPINYKWSDGTPTTTASTPTGIYIAGKGNGFKLTVLATARRQKLSLYLGVWESTGTLTVTLSNTQDSYTNTVTNSQGITNVCYVIEFFGTNPHEELVISWIQTDGNGNVTLQSASLSE